MTTAMDFSPAETAVSSPDAVLMAWEDGAEVAAVTPVIAGISALPSPRFVFVGAARLRALSEHAVLSEHGVHRLRVVCEGSEVAR